MNDHQGQDHRHRILLDCAQYALFEVWLLSVQNDSEGVPEEYRRQIEDYEGVPFDAFLNGFLATLNAGIKLPTMEVTVEDLPTITLN